MSANFKTPEAAHNALIEAVDYELDTYGPASLADVVASLISERYDEDEPKPTDAHWQAAQRAFEKLAEQLNALPLRRRQS